MFENSVKSETSEASAVIRPPRFVRRNLPTGSDKTNRVFRSIDDSKFDIPTIDTRLRYGDLYMRNPKDRIHIKPYDGWDDKPYKPKIPQFISREPSFTTFKVPFQMFCKERYNNFIKKYEGQFGHEIRSLIDNQPTAREATYLYFGLYYFMAAISQ
ncbi:uncharacterized protein LOC135435322 isoform X2 [Drosophila montana]|uniref:uncharacterized protein LOC135435322 isoform X2 n=1 Tax=Drosophila montana TaxID=40370 RepID=UPI00313D9721